MLKCWSLLLQIRGNEPRNASKKILKNRGLVPHRAKMYRNPRIVRKKKYEKAKKRIGGQVCSVQFVVGREQRAHEDNSWFVSCCHSGPPSPDVGERTLHWRKYRYQRSQPQSSDQRVNQFQRSQLPRRLKYYFPPYKYQCVQFCHATSSSMLVFYFLPDRDLRL